ncbi:hypothetical protein F4827_006534 [Paraburkholderia bannensis]|uniref:Uncharacterized protein n=1 Tax=Paraburkholderia bannensis TaxID=765414 RepID=A0A7W9U462_9BURK|nr:MULTISPECIES: hypothetical protein [Paraburkholderia]MBB3261661.1 hypothetical protein [Paraburkholderia sp. WP4_3_2]MBB6106658.1 hypothetical protein [Paraburkholderia bannensis]
MNNIYQQRVTRSPELYRLISSVRDINKRNLLRGYCSKKIISPSEIESIRDNNSLLDSMTIGAVLKGPDGLLERPGSGRKTSKDLYRFTGFSPIDWRNEIAYTIGYVNASTQIASEILGYIKKLMFLESSDARESLGIMLEMTKKFGASNYLSYKLAYLRSARALTTNQMKVVSEIEMEIEHRNNAGMHFSALENVSSKISLFLVAQRRVSGLVGKVDGEFRRALSLSNFIPTPLNRDDLPGFLLRATESSLTDTIYALLVILNLDDEYRSAQDEIRRRITHELAMTIDEVRSHSQGEEIGTIVTDYYRSQSPGAEESLNLYRVASAFLEREKFAKYRNKLDCVFGARLLSEIINGKYPTQPASFNDKDLLLMPDNTPVEEINEVTLDIFYRTFLFLRFIEDRMNMIQLSKNEIKIIMERTLSLETLLTEEEIRSLYLTAPDESRSLVAVLALALFKAKSIDPDVDFEFRTDFISHVKAEHKASILNFIEFLLIDSPQVATYIVSSLDEVTLEKMYTLVANASQASEIRCEILRAIGQKLGKIEYIIESDAITTRSKLSKLQQYFDSSRMYVDSVAMKKWLDVNPSVATEQYRSLSSELRTSISTLGETSEGTIYLIQLIDQNEYLISQIAKDAFEQFCLNPAFGIQSYLGRRIRHNTLDGVTTDTVDAVLRKSEFGVLMSNSRMRRTVETWMDAYKGLVDKLRREHLQFKSSNSLFSSSLDEDDSTTNENLRNLSIALRNASGSELINELVIAFCWKQITPQLENAARFIKTKLLNEANSLIDKFFSGSFGAIEAQMKSELHDAVNEVFKKVADWFQVPQTGFISASVADLCRIIFIELNRQNHVEFSGPALEQKYTGITVHRVYDCLAALLKNAQKHGDADGQIGVHVNAVRANPSSVLEYLSIDITSTVPKGEFSRSRNRIQKAIDSAETGIDMVTEGYTGIKKAKFITRGCEGIHTVRCTSSDDEQNITLSFSMHAEIAQEDVSSGATP